MITLLNDRKGYFNLILISLLFLLCTGRHEHAIEEIAVVGDRIIDWQSVNQSFELEPQWKKGMTNKEAYFHQLQYLIHQKLFALAAHAEALDKDPMIAGFIKYIKHKEMIKALYKKVVAAKVDISEQDYQKAYTISKKRIILNYIYTSDSIRVDTYLKKMRESSFLEVQLIDPLSDIKGTTQPFSFGDMREELEEVVFDMMPGDVAGPFTINDGFMIVQLADGQIDKFMSEQDFALNKSKIRKVLFDRRAAKLANTYIKELMLDKNLQLNPPIFFTLADQMNRTVKNKYADKPLPIYISNEEINIAKGNLTSIQDEILITYQNSQMTVKEFLNNLYQIPVEFRPKAKTSRQLKDAIGVIIRNEYLEKEARKMGLDDDSTVKHNIEKQSDKILAKYWLEKRLSIMNVLPTEVEDHDNSRPSQLFVQRTGEEVKEHGSSPYLKDKNSAEIYNRLIDSLSTRCTIKVDSQLFYSKISNPNEIIKNNPARFIIRELFY